MHSRNRWRIHIYERKMIEQYWRDYDKINPLCIFLICHRPDLPRLKMIVGQIWTYLKTYQISVNIAILTFYPFSNVENNVESAPVKFHSLISQTLVLTPFWINWSNVCGNMVDTDEVFMTVGKLFKGNHKNIALYKMLFFWLFES